MATVLALTACASGGTLRVAPDPPEPAPITEPLAAPLTYAPLAPPAAAYDEPLAAPPAPADDGDAGALVPGGDELVRDPRLDVAARELVALAAHGVTPSPELVAFALHVHGVVEPGHAFVGRGDAAADQQAALAPQLAGPLAAANPRFGVARGDGLALALVVHTSPVRFVAAPRAITGAAEVAGVLAAPYRAPRVTITHDDRTHEALAVEAGDDPAGTTFRTSVACGGHTGTQWLAVFGDGPAPEPGVPDASAPLAVVPITCGDAAPVSYRVEADASLAAPDLARRIAAQLNRERAALHLPLLVPDGPATAAAAAYAARMAALGDVAHDLEHTTPAMRLAVAGRVPVLVEETTLKADDFRQASEILLDDPMYRRQVVDPAVTHVGIGVVTDRHGELFLAIEYVQIVAPADLPALAARATAQLVNNGATLRTSYRARRARRDMAGAPAVDEDLSRLAQEVATEIALGWRADAVTAVLSRRFVDESHRYAAIAHEVILLTDPDATKLDARGVLAPGQVVDNIGVGIAQSSRAGSNSGRIYLVVIAARY